MAEARRPDIKLPKGYANEEAFLIEMRELFSDNQSAETENHRAGVEDLQFVVGKQWDEGIEKERIDAFKPVLTINRLPAFVAQVIGRRKLNETVIKIIPDTGGDKPAAEVREGLVRSIQKLSRAKLAYDNAMSGAVMCGIGNFQVEVDYETDDVWDQCIRIKSILDHFSVVWDRNLTDPTGADAQNCFVLESMTLRDFQERWPWATPADMVDQRFYGETLQSGWFTKNDVRVVAYWRMRTDKRMIALMLDGTTQDITDVDDPAIMGQIAQRPDGSPYMREVNKPYVERYLCSGVDVLEGPYQLPINRIPVFRIPGWELHIGDSNYRWGLIRHLKDPQRLHNYWRSVLAEKIMRSPKSTWVASDEAVRGREEQWRNSATSDDPLLIWNSESGAKPERVEPITVEGALIEQIAVTAQDLKDVSNIHEANLGMPSNEVSGKAINARVAVSNTGTAIYEDNTALAIEEAGRVINDLIPLVYDAPRIIKVIKPDDQEMMVAINMVGNPDSVDITAGKYSVTAITGRSYATKREEAAESMMALAQAMPNTFGVAPDILVEAMDWPEAERLSLRFRRTLPPNILAPDELTPEQQQQMQAQAQGQAQQSAMDQAEQSAKVMKTQADAALSQARAQNYNAQAQAIGPKLQNETVRVASEAASRELRDNLAVIDVATGQ